MFEVSPPHADDVRAAREATGLTQDAAARVVHTRWRTWQTWEYGTRQMPLATWELFLLKTGFVQRTKTGFVQRSHEP